MAHKRRMEVTVEPEPVPEPRERTWGEWLRQDYAKYWFGALSLLINCLVGLQLAYTFEYMAPLYTVFIPAFIILSIIEILVYRRIWGRDES